MLSRLSLRYRIALVIFVLEAAMLAGVLGVTLTQSRQTTTDFNAASQRASLDLLSTLSVTALLTSEYSDYQLYLQDANKQPSLRRIVLADANGRVVAGSQVTDVGRSVGDVMPTTQAGWQVRTVDTPAGALGTLAVQFSDEALTAAHQRTRNLALAIALFGTALVALVGLATGIALTRRLEQVTTAVRRFAGGDHGGRSKVSGGDEIALLSRSFDQMADAVTLQQQQLTQQTEYIELLLNSTAEAIFGTDTDGTCTFVNPACLRMLGYDKPHEMVGKDIHALIHHTYPDGRPYPKEQCQAHLATLQGQAAHADDEVHWRADGSSFPVECWSHPMHRDGRLIGSVVTFIDISERRRAEAALKHLNEGLEARVEQRTAQLVGARDEAERANRAKSEFLSRMSHELRTPLNAILGFGQLLELELREPKPARQVREILHAGKHLLALINDVLDLARVESGKLSVSPESVALLPLVDDCLKLLRPQADVRSIRLPAAAPACNVHLHADRTRLKQVLLNLLSNAIKYNRPGGTVGIDCVTHDNGAGAGRSLSIRVSDTGSGLDAGQQARLFVPFERLDADKQGIEGTGIGLALSKRLVELMDGSIGVQSTPGSGSTFWVRLPLADGHTGSADVAAYAAPAPVPEACGSHRVDVLCIEDNPANLRLIEGVLTRRPGVRLLSAIAPGLGLELARTHRPALILLDINLPDMDGYAVMQCLRENEVTRAIPVVAISANAMPGDLERGKAAGFAAYITKPLDVGRLLQVVDEVIARTPG